MTKFADQLYEDLMREHGAALRSLSEPEPAAPVRARRRATRPAWLTAGMVTATGAVAGGLVLFGGAAAPAFAVTQNPNGTISVKISQASAIDAANARLKAIGVRVVVVPVRAGCPNLASVGSPGLKGTSVAIAASGSDGQLNAITVNAKGVPADETLVLAFKSSNGGVFGASAFVKGEVPSCVSLPAPPATPGPVSGSRQQQSGSQQSNQNSGSGSQGTTTSG